MHVLLRDEEVEALRQIDNEVAQAIARRHDEAVAALATYSNEIETARGYDIVDDDLEIDEQPMIATAEDGVWVSAWIWVPGSEE